MSELPDPPHELAPASSPESLVARIVERDRFTPYTGSVGLTGQLSIKVLRAGTRALTFAGKDAAELAGITYRQLDYWARTDLVRPKAKQTPESPGRRYTYEDVLNLRIVKTLLDAGIPLRRIRAAVPLFNEKDDIASLHIVIEGDEVSLVSVQELVARVNDTTGVLNILPIDGVRQELDQRIARLVAARDLAAAQTELPLGGTG